VPARGARVDLSRITPTAAATMCRSAASGGDPSRDTDHRRRNLRRLGRAFRSAVAAILERSAARPYRGSACTHGVRDRRDTAPLWGPRQELVGSRATSRGNVRRTTAAVDVSTAFPR
jgi:hypothetical protein